jgi:serine/threonine protein kinase
VVKKFGALDIRRAVSYVRQVALGLDYAFRNSLIHRDIKPGNILIDRQGIARILDMGLARFLNDHTDQLTLKYDDKIVLGTADYVAPEQVANSHAVDIRADIYALGATLYFLLAGHPPFPTGTVSQKLLWHRTKDPTPLRQIRPEVPDELAAIVTRMMAKDPRARYQTPAQLAADLEPFLDGPVPLPAEEEMPLLSPAATELAAELPAAPVPFPALAPVPALVGASAPTAAPASPFGPAAVSPWGTPPRPAAQSAPFATGKPPSRAAMAPLPPAPAPHAAETAAAPPRTLPVKRSNPFLATNPFASDATQSAPQVRKLPWTIILVGVASVIALGIMLAKLVN